MALPAAQGGGQAVFLPADGVCGRGATSGCAGGEVAREGAAGVGAFAEVFGVSHASWERFCVCTHLQRSFWLLRLSDP